MLSLVPFENAQLGTRQTLVLDVFDVSCDDIINIFPKKIVVLFLFLFFLFHRLCRFVLHHRI